MIIIDIISYSFLCFLSLTTGFFALQIFCSLFSKKTAIIIPDHMPDTAIIIPAHNEELMIKETLSKLIAQKIPNTRIIVVADNCSDDTANIAREFNIEVLERHNPDHRGKGYALEFGVAHLKDTPPDVVIIFDADCIAENNSLEHISSKAHVDQKPVQAQYLMDNSGNPSLIQKVAAFAFYVKNYARPLGLRTLNLPCQLMGTGMAFPWDILKKADIGNGNIVEDMKLGIDLVSSGMGAHFYPVACVRSHFPSSEDALKSQRTRWEHGHMNTIFTEAIPLFMRGVLKLKPTAIFFALDLAILPLSFLLLILSLNLSASVMVSYFTNKPLYLTWSIILLANFLIWSLLAWTVYGRKFLSLTELFAIPIYILAKIPIYLKLIVKREKKWKRTDRDS